MKILPTAASPTRIFHSQNSHSLKVTTRSISQISKLRHHHRPSHHKTLTTPPAPQSILRHNASGTTSPAFSQPRPHYNAIFRQTTTERQSWVRDRAYASQVDPGRQYAKKKSQPISRLTDSASEWICWHCTRKSLATTLTNFKDVLCSRWPKAQVFLPILRLPALGLEGSRGEGGHGWRDPWLR